MCAFTKTATALGQKIGDDINGEAAYDYSGYSVSLSSDGSVVAIGAYNNQGDNGKNSGHVRIYQIELDKTSPSITGPSGSAGDGSSSKSINENSTAVHTFTANESVTWSLNGGADVGKFNINSSSGALSFSSVPDRMQDSGNDNSYVVGIRATDDPEIHLIKQSPFLLMILMN